MPRAKSIDAAALSLSVYNVLYADLSSSVGSMLLVLKTNVFFLFD